MNIKYNKALWLVAILAVITLVPFLGLTDFNTKGEPREAVVAYTMLEHGNWVLPINNGGDIPYKPPFFHWCIALFSLVIGHVNEFTSRLPSAIALIAMTIGGFVFYARKRDGYTANGTAANGAAAGTIATALLAAVLTLTAFEVHRAGNNCRVDMVNTAFMVGALYLMYRWWERVKHALPWWAVLCMSGAALTKGPVGILLPCFVMGVFMLAQRENVWSAVWRMGVTALLSAVIPLVWYYAAWQQGGSEFLRLVKEENIDRLLGKMSYESHENPFWYNFITLITGWLPYTLLMLCSLFTLPWKRFGKSKLVQSIRRAEPLQMFTWLAFALILFFYCIPKSKRSVYLLPCYPFMAWLMAQYIVWLVKEKAGALKVYGYIMAVLVLLTVAVLGAVRCGLVPDTIFHGKHAADNVAMLSALAHYPMHIWNILIVLLTLAAVWLVFRYLHRGNLQRAATATVGMVVALFLLLDSTILPPILNSKADKPLAPVIERRFDMTRLYSYMSTDMLHFFSLNFYLGDRIQQFEKVHPANGVLMIPEDDMPGFVKTLGRGYTFKKVWEISRAVECKHAVGFYQFRKN